MRGLRNRQRTDLSDQNQEPVPIPTAKKRKINEVSSSVKDSSKVQESRSKRVKRNEDSSPTNGKGYSKPLPTKQEDSNPKRKEKSVPPKAKSTKEELKHTSKPLPDLEETKEKGKTRDTKGGKKDDKKSPPNKQAPKNSKKETSNNQKQKKSKYVDSESESSEGSEFSGSEADAESNSSADLSSFVESENSIEGEQSDDSRGFENRRRRQPAKAQPRSRKILDDDDSPVRPPPRKRAPFRPKVNKVEDEGEQINTSGAFMMKASTANADPEELGFDGTRVEGHNPYQNMMSLIELTKDGPWFTHPENILDGQMRAPQDDDYDPSTLFIPKEEWKRFTPGMVRYWEIKSKNFDKIVFYRFGEWFIMYHQDAAICSKILDLCIPPRQTQKMIGFHQSHLKENIELLVNAGYKVAICEQTETTKQMHKRIVAESGNADADDLKAVNREVAQIFTKGTFFKMEGNFDYDTKYVLSYFQQPNTTKFGFSYFDMSTLKFYLGSFEDDFTLKQFRTLTLQTRPVEVVCASTMHTNSESMAILKNSPMPPATTFISMQDIGNGQRVIQKLDQYLGTDHAKWPKALAKIIIEDKDELAKIALGLNVVYLEKLLLAESTIPVADFFTRDEESQELLKSGTMVIDAQAIEHLELLEVAGRTKNSSDGSFFNFLSQGCATAFGKRLLKRWVVGPLKDSSKINARLDVVQDLVKMTQVRDSFENKIKRLPDIERMLSRIYTYSAKSTVKAIYIDIAVLNRLDEFFNVLNFLKRLKTIISEIFDKKVLSELQSERLKNLVTFKKMVESDTKVIKKHRNKKKSAEDPIAHDDNALYPDYEPVIEKFEKMIQWKTVGGKKVPEPIKGLDAEFDEANARVQKLKQRIQDYLEDLKKQLKNKNLTYNTASKRFRFEIECPHDFARRMPSDFVNTSNAKEKARFQSDELRQMIEQLEEAEDKFKDALVPFLRTMFQSFYEHREVFSKAVECVAELDCLCALASISANEQFGPMCKPEIIEDNGGDPYIELRQMRHPCVQEQMGRGAFINRQAPRRFVPNDCVMGKLHGKAENPNILLITGPNMGGKSTLLRQTCLAAIMAQIGCYVPAVSCRLTVVDRVFTRIGASDRILENKSTFFVELEETKTIVEQATANSLVIMDELGRGTSTFDGYSIAHSVLTFLASKIKCRALFTTHYHMLVEDFKQMRDKIGLYNMTSHVEASSNQVKFLYKFEPGIAPQSFGIFVAKMAGIPDNVLHVAQQKSSQFNTKLELLTNKVRMLRLKD